MKADSNIESFALASLGGKIGVETRQTLKSHGLNLRFHILHLGKSNMIFGIGDINC